MQNIQGQTNPNIQSGTIPQQFRHGGHEIFDVHEILSGSIDTLNSYMMWRQHVKDQELRDILDRQYSFMADEYNITLDCFKSGKDPAKPTQTYNMKQGNDFIYGLTPSQPKKPMQSMSEISDECISSWMLGAVKSGAWMKTMAALEVTNPVVRRVLADSVPNCIEMAYEISLYQNKHHYYQVPQLSQPDMQTIINSFAGASTQISTMTH